MAMIEWKIRRSKIGESVISILLCDDDTEFMGIFGDEILDSFKKLNLKAEISTYKSVEYIPEDKLASCDMAFLDIDFEGEEYNGINIAQKLREVNDKAILFFVTNFIDYAPAGYEVKAFRYILKRDRNEVLDRYIMQATEQIADDREFLDISGSDSFTEILLDDITYFEVLGHEVIIHEKEGVHTLNSSLSSLEEQLDKCGLLRVHNSYLVNMHYIGKYRSRECILTDGTLIPVSERNYSVQKQKYLLWKGFR